jgi:ABC-type Zn uptake system ZnuABC Zn-binding protein ZnuA
VSLPIFADLAREMGGDQVTVTTLVPPGVDPRTYIPSEDQAAMLEEADLVFVNGLGLDQPTIDFVEAHHPDRRFFVVDFVRNIPSPSRQQPLGGMPIFAKEVGDEPHLFLDPVLVPVYAQTISHSLVIIDGLNEAHYSAVFEAYKGRLGRLHEKIAEETQRIPAQNRPLIVAERNSLIHFANRYGLGIAGTLDDNGEDGLRGVIEERHPPAVFMEAGVDPEPLKRLAGEAGIKTCEVSAGTVTAPSVTYIGMMEHDAEQIVACLGG